MPASPCSRCGGTRWVRYFSETTSGSLEEAFRLCPCNHELKVRGESSREEQERTKNKTDELNILPDRDAQH
jgi:hypothetical protein